VTLWDRQGSHYGSQHELLTAADVGAMLSMKPREIERCAMRGELPCTWIGNRPMFREEAIERFLRDQDYREQEYVDVEDVHLPVADQVELPAPYQRTDGRWSVRLVCPDGVSRRFVSRVREPVQPEHRRVTKRIGLSAHTRFSVLRRDDFTCRYCGRRPPEVALEIDHRIPIVDGGTDEIENLLTACWECNAGKGARASKAAFEVGGRVGRQGGAVG
jgi:hypothetical protein